jgi:hypothetical protein
VFFSAAPEGDEHGSGLTENAPDARERHEAGEAVEVVQQLELGHRKSMTSFPEEGKRSFPGNCRPFRDSRGKSYPLKNAKSPISFPTVRLRQYAVAGANPEAG